MYKNWLKWIKDVHITQTNIKLIEENIGEKLPNLWFGNEFLDMAPQAQATKEKTLKKFTT